MKKDIYMIQKISVALLVIMMITIYGQNIHDETLRQAKESYVAKDYQKTADIIKAYLKKNGKAPETEKIVPLLLESLIRINDVKYFKKVSSYYQKKFPSSKFIPRLHYLSGVIDAQEKNYKRAFKSFSKACQMGVSPKLETAIRKNINKIYTEKRIQKTMGWFFLSRLHDVVAETIAYHELKFYYLKRAKNNKDKIELCQDYRRKYLDSPYNEKIIVYMRSLSGKKVVEEKTKLTIGVMAPFTGPQQELGKQVLKSVTIAVEEYNATHAEKITLIYADTKGNMVETATKVHELIERHNVTAIVGPVLSKCATVAATALLDHPEIIMITPTATDNGIAQLGKNIFQLNVTLSSLAKKIARYAFQDLKINKFAILSPTTEYGDVCSAAFKAEIQKLGGEILVEEHFNEEAADFRIQFQNIRNRMAEIKYDEDSEPLDSLTAKDLRGLNKERQSYIEDSIIDIGGLFLPVEPANASKLCSQAFFHRLRTQFLGTNGWHSNETILQGKRYVNGAVFSTNFEAEKHNPRWQAFSSTFTKKYSSAPDPVVSALAYDAAKVLIAAIAKGSDSKETIEHLLNTQKFLGVSGVISFDNSDGVNMEAAIMKISNRKFIKLQ